MELEIENTEVVSADNIQIEAPGLVEVIEGEKDYEVSVVKKEYTIIGDSIFIPSMYEDAPPWLKEFIDTTLNVAVTNRDQSLIDRLQSMLSLLDYVPKNQYTEQINQIVSEDGIINSRIATLNSNFTDSINTTNATIAEINLTYASKNEAAAIASNILTASLSGSGEIGSTLIELQEAYANLESTTAQSISMLESVMEGEINGNATAMETIRTYVGIDEAGAGTGTGLSAYLEASDGTIGGADSQLANTIRVTAEGVESKFAYNSIVNINGVYKRSGFGLTTNYTSGAGTQANPYVSEFWIDASRLKFTNSNQTGQTAPFTIDATGTTPQITFNGKVSFTNVTGTSSLALKDMSNVTTIDGGKISTNTLYGNSLIGNTVSADKLTSSTGASTTWTGGGLVSQNFNGNPVGNIGSPTQGFRLSSNATGTKTDPNIYGAYIKGGILEGSNLWLSTSAGYAKVQYINMLYYNFELPPSPFVSTTYSHYIELVSPTYGSGYIPNRVFSLSSSAISVVTSGAINSTIVGVNLSLQYSADGGSWTKLDQFSGSLPGVNVLYYGLCPYFNSTLRIRLAISYINSSGMYYSSTASAALTLINQN